MDQGALTPTDTGVPARFLLDGLHGACCPWPTKASRACQPASAESSAASSPRPARHRTRSCLARPSLDHPPQPPTTTGHNCATASSRPAAARHRQQVPPDRS
jgi:hypothetical protein